MADLISNLSHIRLGLRRSRRSTKIVVVTSAIVCVIALVTLYLSMSELSSRTETLRSRAAALEQSNSDLQDQIDGVGTVNSIIQIAEEKLGLVQSGTVIYQPED